MSEHYEMRCRHGTLMGQCRCPSLNKTVKLAPCNRGCDPEKHPVFAEDCPECNTRHPKGWVCPKQFAALKSANQLLESQLRTKQEALDKALGEVGRLEKYKDGAYSERDRLVAALSKLLPSWLERHPDEDTGWEDDWRWIVFVDPPSGQMTWHIHDSELPWFDHLPRSNAHRWDGHSTEEKYERLATLAGTSPDEKGFGEIARLKAIEQAAFNFINEIEPGDGQQHYDALVDAMSRVESPVPDEKEEE